MSHTMPGPGDPVTWPAFTGHPNDPRHPGDDGECSWCGCPLDDDGECSDGCYGPPEPDYEAMAEDRGW